MDDIRRIEVSDLLPLNLDENVVVELTRDDILNRIDRGAQQRLGISGRALLCAYRARRLQDPGRVADLLVLADLLPEEDWLLAGA